MSSGLDDVVAAETVLSDVDGKSGRLVIRGRTVEDLAAHDRFEDTAHLLFGGQFDDLPDVAGLTQALAAARRAAFAALPASLPDLPPLEAVRALIARLPDADDLPTAMMLLAAPAVFTPATARAHRGLEPIAPKPGARHAEDVLHMLGVAGGVAPARALDAICRR